MDWKEVDTLVSALLEEAELSGQLDEGEQNGLTDALVVFLESLPAPTQQVIASEIKRFTWKPTHGHLWAWQGVRITPGVEHPWKTTQ